MATSASSGGWKSESFIGEIRELWELVITYLKQETIDPVKGLGRYVGYGLGGSLAIGLASILLLLGILRLLQERRASCSPAACTSFPTWWSSSGAGR